MKMRISALLFCLISAAFTARAQVASATLLGEVRDESAALAPRVTVTARQDSTGFSRSAVTTPQGAYRIADLAPGAYTVSAEKSGFRTVTAEHVLLEVNQNARLDLVLKIGAARDSITVQASVSPVQSDDASVGYRLDKIGRASCRERV